MKILYKLYITTNGKFTRFGSTKKDLPDGGRDWRVAKYFDSKEDYKAFLSKEPIKEK